MLDHLGINASNFETSRQFYEASLAALGITKIMEVTPEQTGGYHGIGYGADGNPFFWLGNAALHSSGIHIAFAAADRAAVNAFYAVAIEQGGRDNGGPGLRPEYHENYYAAFVLDPDGINVEAVCHLPE